MAKKRTTGKSTAKGSTSRTTKKRAAAKPSSLLDTRVIYCGDCLEQLRNLPDNCVDLIYISQIRRGGDPPFNSNWNR